MGLRWDDIILETNGRTPPAPFDLLRVRMSLGRGEGIGI